MCISGFVKKHESRSIWSNVKGNKTCIYIYIYIYIKFYETCKCRLDAIVCNVNNIGMKINACVNWNVRNKLMKAVDKGFIWNPSECKCDKSCDVWEYFD